MIRQVFSTLTAALVAVSIGAQPVLADSTLEDHANLLHAIESAGVRVYINPSHCALPQYAGVSGFYVSQSKVFVVCQDGGNGDGNIVAMTDNDLDTIRHESQHVIQDCLDGIGNGQLQTFFPEEATKEGQITHYEFVTSVLSPRDINRITHTYGSNGATPEVILLEYEAFAVSRAISAEEITSVVQQVCPVSN